MYRYQFVRDVIDNFDGDGKKFYPLFYDSVSGDDIVFKNLNRKCSVILGFEVVNSVLAHLNGAITPRSSFLKNCGFTKKQWNTREHRSDSNIKHISIPLQEKILQFPQKKMANSLMPKTEVAFGKTLLVFLKFFLLLRSILDAMFQTRREKIDIHQMVSSLMMDFSIQSHFITLQNYASQEPEDETALNLLEGMLTLYLRARIFKYVSLQKEAFKLETSRKKMKSLGTLIKQATKKLEFGH